MNENTDPTRSLPPGEVQPWKCGKCGASGHESTLTLAIEALRDHYRATHFTEQSGDSEVR